MLAIGPERSLEGCQSVAAFQVIWQIRIRQRRLADGDCIRTALYDLAGVFGVMETTVGHE